MPPTGTLTMERCSLIDVSSRGSAGEIEITAGRIATIHGLVLSESALTGVPNQPRGGGPITVFAGCGLTVTDTGVISSKGLDPGADLVLLKSCEVLINGVVQSTSPGGGHVLPVNPANRCNDDPAAHPPGAAAALHGLRPDPGPERDDRRHRRPQRQRQHRRHPREADLDRHLHHRRHHRAG